MNIFRMKISLVVSSEDPLKIMLVRILIKG